ncbi:MAG: N-acetyl-1-D-myo-inositol-2-amino-2-deoxy-alpha-D-glucopyranoside deacetylase [Pseudonocardiales bacterium]|nr:N-acetyl-1-D-myo-inositol-2-amino-2-deoxy-alpha-D-glucopyranoside deacetylase [Pseudonocardiales bacterium]MBV9730803.1 N-acetyl-1-D-myo-inositol-2-amino-2-deoxy-alpha-D-glucopyranoside deacetylase [Pseudonocardiales bacterium]
MSAPTGRRLVVVHAHPDDETLWTGGMIARYAAGGVAVTLVTCTLGEQGEVLIDELRGLAADRADQLGGYRVAELRAACAALGTTEQRFLGGIGRWRDSGMVWRTRGRASAPTVLHPRAFAAGMLDEQVDALVEVLEQVRPQVLVSYGPDGGYGHPDHVRAHQVTMAAAAQIPEVARVLWAVRPVSAVAEGITALRAVPGLPFPLPGSHGLPGVPDAEVTTALDVSAHRNAVLAAMRAHATQIRVWTAGAHAAFALSDGVAQPMFDTEYFTLVRGAAAGAHDDLFGGLPGPVTASQRRSPRMSPRMHQ